MLIIVGVGICSIGFKALCFSLRIGLEVMGMVGLLLLLLLRFDEF